LINRRKLDHCVCNRIFTTLIWGGAVWQANSFAERLVKKMQKPSTSLFLEPIGVAPGYNMSAISRQQTFSTRLLLFSSPNS